MNVIRKRSYLALLPVGCERTKQALLRVLGTATTGRPTNVSDMTYSKKKAKR